MLGQIADFQSREKELKAKVMTALLYPLILLVLATGVLIFLLVFFIPRFQLIFAGFGARLPMITQIIIGISETIRSYVGAGGDRGGSGDLQRAQLAPDAAGEPRVRGLGSAGDRGGGR